MLEGLPGTALFLGKGCDIDVHGAIKLLSPHPAYGQKGENDNDIDTVSHVLLFSKGKSSELGMRLVFIATKLAQKRFYGVVYAIERKHRYHR